MLCSATQKQGWWATFAHSKQPQRALHIHLCGIARLWLQTFCITTKLSELIEQIATTDSAKNFMQQRGFLRRQSLTCPTCNHDMTMVKSDSSTDGVCFRCPSHKGQKSSIRSGSFLFFVASPCNIKELCPADIFLGIRNAELHRSGNARTAPEHSCAVV